jgi:hypothetical protein
MLLKLCPDAGPELRSKSVTEAVAADKRILSLEKPLNEMEPKLDWLLEAKEGGSSHPEILRRLTELEQKLDRVLKPRAGQ